jgi:hypothetical protein
MCNSHLAKTLYSACMYLEYGLGAEHFICAQ